MKTPAEVLLDFMDEQGTGYTNRAKVLKSLEKALEEHRVRFIRYKDKIIGFYTWKPVKNNGSIDLKLSNGAIDKLYRNKFSWYDERGFLKSRFPNVGKAYWKRSADGGYFYKQIGG